MANDSAMRGNGGHQHEQEAQDVGNTSLQKHRENIRDEVIEIVQREPVSDKSTKKSGALLYFSNKGFDEDVPVAENRTKTVNMVWGNPKSESRKASFKSKLKRSGMALYLRAIGVGLLCLIILALFVVPPSTTW